MAWHHGLRSAVSSLLGRRKMEEDMDEEMRFHLEMEAQRLEKSGMSRAEARRQAARDFGGLDRYKEGVRDERGARGLEDVGQDVRYAMRTLGRRPGFTAVAVITLALGIGATTALFGVVKAVLMAPLPYRDSGSVAVLWSAWTGFDQTWLSYDEYEAWDSEIPAIDNVGLYSGGSMVFSGEGEPERVRAAFVTEDVFQVLGVEPVVGRGFTKEEDRPGGPPVVVLSYGLWQRRFGGDPAIVGRDVQVNGSNSTVVGVMPEGFKLPLDFGSAGPTEAWAPLATDAPSEGALPGPQFSPGGGSHGFYGVARLVPGATTSDVNRQLDAHVAGLVRDKILPKEMQFRAFAVPVQ